MSAVVIDGKGHLLGRLASVVAKQLILGNHVVVVRTEAINISGHIFKNHIKQMDWMGKRRNSNPTRGFHHYVSPSRIFWKSVKGMLPNKLAKGEAALARLKVFEGVPHPYDEKKRMVVPAALKALRIRNYRKVTVLGDLAQKVGWTKQEVVASLEEKRLAKAKKYYEKKQAADKARTKSASRDEVKKIQDELTKYGF